jgi:hypothetical protein
MNKPTARPRTSWVLTAISLLVLLASITLTVPASAGAEGPGVGAPWVVSVGDSYISGEAGRWAGNTDKSPSEVDALGHNAYDDNPSHTAELISGCHRSRSAEVYIGGGVNGENLACSGAQTVSLTEKGKFKPGLDFHHSGNQEGQALMLEKFATTHNVKLVPLSIGGNNFHFSGIVEKCLEDFLIPFFHIHCHNKKPVTTELAPANVARQREAIRKGIENIEKAMLGAGYTATQFTILVQDYPSPIPIGANIRYQETYRRQKTGGCGLWNVDANAVNSTMLPTINHAVFAAAAGTHMLNVKTMDLTDAFAGHRLCSKHVGLLEEKGLISWTQPGAVDKTEWISQVRTASTLFGPYELQEDLHPSYWGQLALRNCLTQAYNGGTPKGGVCAVAGEGVNGAGEPKVILK